MLSNNLLKLIPLYLVIKSTMKSKYNFYILWVVLMALMLLGCSEPSHPIRPIPTFNRELPSNELTLDNVYAEIMANNIRFGDVVLAQAVHETGWFTSHNCLKRNNLFGYKGGQKTIDNPQGYKIYDHWRHSVKAYKEYQERNVPESCTNYYEYLRFANYAADGDQYVSNLKKYKFVIIKNCE